MNMIIQVERILIELAYVFGLVSNGGRHANMGREPHRGVLAVPSMLQYRLHSLTPQNNADEYCIW